MKHNSVQGMGEVIRSYRIAAESDACGEVCYQYLTRYVKFKRF
jgi:hypothetical protein